MGQVLRPENIATLVKTFDQIVSMGPSIITIGGQQYQTDTALTVNTTLSGVGGLDTGTWAQNTHYYAYAITHGLYREVGLIGSLNNLAPSGYSAFRPVGEFDTDSNIFIQNLVNTVPKGTTGIQGNTGITGFTGISGETGVQGISGETGVFGLTGIQGETGLIGFTGVPGNTGLQGIIGITGETGAQGIQGNTGVVGTTGIIGLQGFTGVQGYTGVFGFTGIQGIQGNTGITQSYVDVNISALDINWALGDSFYKLISTNSTFTFSNVSTGQKTVIIKNTSGASVTVTFPVGILKSGTLNQTILAGKENVYTFLYSNSKTYVAVVADMD